MTDLLPDIVERLRKCVCETGSSSAVISAAIAEIERLRAGSVAAPEQPGAAAALIREWRSHWAHHNEVGLVRFADKIHATLVTQTAALQTAADAIAHLLNRIGQDPRLAYYFDPSTQSMACLTRAYAELRGLDVEEWRKDYYARLRFEKPLCHECREEEVDQ